MQERIGHDYYIKKIERACIWETFFVFLIGFIFGYLFISTEILGEKAYTKSIRLQLPTDGPNSFEEKKSRQIED